MPVYLFLHAFILCVCVLAYISMRAFIFVCEYVCAFAPVHTYGYLCICVCVNNVCENVCLCGFWYKINQT